jgi:diguanylate cyclase (GGDEF)-like protein
LRATRRVVVLAAVSLAFLVALAGIMGWVTESARSEVDGVADRVLPASEHLGVATDLLNRSHAQFLRALAGPSEERAARVAAAQDLQVQAEAEWTAYLRRAPFGPEERALQSEFVDAGDRTTEAGAAAFALADSPDRAGYEAALAAELQAHESRQAVAVTIRRRFYDRDVRVGVQRTSDALARVDRVGMGIIAFTALVIVTLSVVTFRRYAGLERVKAKRDDERHQHDRLADLEVQLRRGLEMEPNEDATYEVVEVGVRSVRGDEPTEVLLAGGPEEHFRCVVRTGAEEPGTSCQVPSPRECPATAGGNTRVFRSSVGIDVCPFLRHREGPPVSAVCVPIGIAGTASGVIHAVGPAGRPPEDGIVVELELLAREAGERIGFLRVLSQTEAQAETDHLTGLWNRRTLLARVRHLLDRDDRFVVAYVDLDHFKDLNDTHGRDAGDRALRRFARVLRDGVRPTDLPARYGGEEFVVVLPECSLGDAVLVVERVREQLGVEVAASSVEAFTMSVGLAARAPAESFDATVGRADEAMRLAKERGGDHIATTEDLEPTERASGGDASSTSGD